MIQRCAAAFLVGFAIAGCTPRRAVQEVLRFEAAEDGSYCATVETNYGDRQVVAGAPDAQWPGQIYLSHQRPCAEGARREIPVAPSSALRTVSDEFLAALSAELPPPRTGSTFRTYRFSIGKRELFLVPGPPSDALTWQVDSNGYRWRTKWRKVPDPDDRRIVLQTIENFELDPTLLRRAALQAVRNAFTRGFAESQCALFPVAPGIAGTQQFAGLLLAADLSAADWIHFTVPGPYRSSGEEVADAVGDALSAPVEILMLIAVLVTGNFRMGL